MNADIPPDEGATPVVHDDTDACITVIDGVRRPHGHHKFVWIWTDDTWTDQVVCTTCGIIRINREKP